MPGTSSPKGSLGSADGVHCLTCRSPTPSVAVTGDWVFGKELGSDEAMRVGYSSCDVLVIKDTRDLALPPTHHEDRARRQLSASQEEGLYQKPAVQAASSWTPSLQNCEK